MSLLVMPPQAGSDDAVMSPQSRSSAPVVTPSPQRGAQFDRLVANPDSVSWKFDSLGFRSAWKTAISYVRPIISPRFTLRIRQSAGWTVSTIVIGSIPGQGVIAMVAALMEPPSVT